MKYALQTTKIYSNIKSTTITIVTAYYHYHDGWPTVMIVIILLLSHSIQDWDMYIIITWCGLLNFMIFIAELKFLLRDFNGDLPLYFSPPLCLTQAWCNYHSNHNCFHWNLVEPGSSNCVSCMQAAIYLKESSNIIPIYLS